MLIVVACSIGCMGTPTWWSPILKEQKTVEYCDPAELPHARIPETPPPPTVSNPQPPDSPEWHLSLDEAIRTALYNSEVVRILVGVTATSSGVTIYDPAIANTAIDQQQGRFDPALSVTNSFDRSESPQAVLDADVPEGARIDGLRTDDYNMNLDLSKTTIMGGTASLGVNTNPSRFRPGVFPLDPQNRSSVELSYVQPLLSGGGIGPNIAPIVLARIDTERSFFQYKDSVQELVRSVLEAYWGVVFARTDLWAREQQVEQGTEAYEREVARKRAGFGTQADVSQAQLALANFRASRITASANLLQSEAALRNIMGLPPTDERRLIPTTPPTNVVIQFEWNEVIRLSEERRPDLIELKLILEADEQQLRIARNQALPEIDAVMLYRWNGLEGETPSGSRIGTGGGQFTDWTLGVNFSVPLGLRQPRAAVRERELLIARDRANLNQGVHNAVHILAGNIRNIDEFYQEYLAIKETREAARENLEQQIAENRTGQTILLNVLQAITSWGNAVSAEAQSLTQYNVELANLEQQSGTILETHGIRFVEERRRFAGPLLMHKVCYPSDIIPTPNENRYSSQDKPAESFFDLSNPLYPDKDRIPSNPAKTIPPLPEANPLEPLNPDNHATEFDDIP